MPGVNLLGTDFIFGDDQNFRLPQYLYLYFSINLIRNEYAEGIFLEFNLPPTYSNLVEYLALFGKEHPCSKIFYIGKSVLGRRIPVLTLGKPGGCALFVGGTHGSEWLTVLALLRFFDEVCTKFEHREKLYGINLSTALAKRGIAVIPVLNPDGTEINLRGKSGGLSAAGRIERLAKGDYSHWNANARGVDINHNFDAGWADLQLREREKGIFGPAPRQYGGPRPFSEPETRAVCGFCATFEVSRLWSLHSQGEEIYWYYGNRTPLLSRDIAEEFSAATGYKIASPKGLAVGGGLKDWYIEKFGRPGFTVEIGSGENPLPFSDFDGIYQKLLPGLVRAIVM